MIREFRAHPEAKSLGPDGRPCGKRTTGLLQRRPVVATETVVIGKEANELEQVETGLIDELEEVQTVYRRDRSAALREQLRGDEREGGHGVHRAEPNGRCTTFEVGSDDPVP